MTTNELIQHLLYGDIEEMPLSVLGDECPTSEEYNAMNAEQQTRLAAAATVAAAMEGRLHPSGFLNTKPCGGIPSASAGCSETEANQP